MLLILEVLLILVITVSLLVAFFIFKKLKQNENRFALLISIFSFLVTGSAIAVGSFLALIYLGAFTR